MEPVRDRTAHIAAPLEYVFAHTHVVEASGFDSDCICKPMPMGSQTNAPYHYHSSKTAFRVQ